jgi:predicted RNase H-like HicB family nuclease
MKTIIQFRVTKGDSQFVAECLDLSIITQAKTLDELAVNIEEALTLHLQDENLEELEIAENHSVLVSFELPHMLHAKA